METDTARIKFNGINNTDKFSVSLMVAIGKYPGDPQHKVNAKEGKFIVSSSDTSVGIQIRILERYAKNRPYKIDEIINNLK